MTPITGLRVFACSRKRPAAFASFSESETGVIDVGRWADLTIMDIDPFQLSEDDPHRLLDGRIIMTIVDGDIIYEAP